MLQPALIVTPYPLLCFHQGTKNASSCVSSYRKVNPPAGVEPFVFPTDLCSDDSNRSSPPRLKQQPFFRESSPSSNEEKRGSRFALTAYSPPSDEYLKGIAGVPTDVSSRSLRQPLRLSSTRFSQAVTQYAQRSDSDTFPQITRVVFDRQKQRERKTRRLRQRSAKMSQQVAEASQLAKDATQGIITGRYSSSTCNVGKRPRWLQRRDTARGLTSSSGDSNDGCEEQKGK